MQLAPNVTVVFQDRKITEEFLREHRRKEEFSSRRGLRGDQSDDVTILALLAHSFNTTISPDPKIGTLVLATSFKRFPCLWNGEEGYVQYSIRLIPTHGSVGEIHCGHRLENYIENTDVSVRVNPFGEGNCLEVYIHPPTESLAEPIPPANLRTKASGVTRKRW